MRLYTFILLTFLFIFPISVSAQVAPTRVRYVNTLPATCDPSSGEVAIKVSVSPTEFYWCDTSNHWQKLGTSTTSGTVTSVDASGGTTGLTFSGGPVTSSGTLTLSGTLGLANGGTNATSASGARTSLGLGTLATQSGTFSGTSSGTNTGDQTITLTGDVTGSGSGSFATTLASVGTAGTYRSVTTDAKGRVTAGTNPTTFSGYGLSDTSANLATTLTDETGSGLAVFGTSPTIVTPTIASFANANHNHTNSAGGGQLTISAFSSTTGTGAVVGANTPTLITPVIGAATGTSLIVTNDVRAANLNATTGLALGYTGVPTAGLTLEIRGNQARFGDSGGTNRFDMGRDNAVTGDFQVIGNQSGFSSYDFQSTGSGNLFKLTNNDLSIVTAGKGIKLNSTITGAGTTGAQTINKTAGSVNFAAGATSLVVTNSTVTASSIIIATVATNDGTLKSVQCVAGSGTFTMYANAAATAETRVNFIVIN